jgi:CheY-like chemotaxis protein
MDFNSVVEKLPVYVSSLVDSIYIVSESKNEFYDIKYNGNEINVSKKFEFNEIEKYVSKDILTKEEKRVINNKLYSVVNDGDYKVVFVTEVVTETIKQEEKNEEEDTVELDDRDILIIADDSPVITKFFNKIFDETYNVFVATNGKEAIDLVNKYKDKQLVGCFFDLQMPGTDGYYALDYFKENNLFKDIPVSIISGEEDSAAIANVTENYNIIDMLQKPFGIDAAKSIVSKTISFSPKNK